MSHQSSAPPPSRPKPRRCPPMLRCLFCRLPLAERRRRRRTSPAPPAAPVPVNPPVAIPPPPPPPMPFRHHHPRPNRMNSLSEPLPPLPSPHHPHRLPHFLAPKSAKSTDQIGRIDHRQQDSTVRKPSIADSINELLWRRHKRRKEAETQRRSRSESVISHFGEGGAREPVEPLELVGLEAASNADTRDFDALLRWALLQVSVDTMAITALPLDCWLKERLKNWVQLSGHQGTIVPASNHTLWKRQPQGNQTEARAYAKIMEDPALRGITPKFYKEIAHKQETFIEIQDLLAQFPNTSTRAIMDIKIGTRTFLESEVTNTAKREDLYRKMVELAPDEPTEEERAEGRVTKLRYMQFRERESSSATLGFRIEAAQMPGAKLQKNFKKVRGKPKCRQTLMHFLDSRADELRVQLVARLRHIRTAVEQSQFFRTHEVVGSSVLIIYDHQRLGAWLIDFAKSNELEQGQQLSHRGPWTLGNHEDGWLIGLDNLIGILEGTEEANREEGQRVISR